LLAVVVHAADEESADCARAEAGGIHRHLGAAATDVAFGNLGPAQGEYDSALLWQS